MEKQRIEWWNMREFDIIKNFHIKHGVLMLVCDEEKDYEGISDIEYKVEYGENESPLYLKVEKYKDYDQNIDEWVIYAWNGYNWDWFDWLTFTLND